MTELQTTPNARWNMGGKGEFLWALGPEGWCAAGYAGTSSLPVEMVRDMAGQAHAALDNVVEPKLPPSKRVLSKLMWSRSYGFAYRLVPAEGTDLDEFVRVVTTELDWNPEHVRPYGGEGEARSLMLAGNVPHGWQEGALRSANGFVGDRLAALDVASVHCLILGR